MSLSENDIKILQDLLEKNNSKLRTDLKNDLVIYIDERFDQVITDLKVYIDEKISKLRNDIMNYVDTFAKEISANRDERITMAHQIGRNTQRIEKLEDKVLTN